MDTTFMNSANSKTSDPQAINMLLYQILASTVHGKV